MPYPTRLLIALIQGIAATATLQADPTIYHYDGDTLPTVGAYAGWFTTVGPGHPTGYYFGNTTWSSDGSSLAMNTSHSPSEGIWFGRTDGYFDPSNFSLADTAAGNWVRASIALSPGATEWSLYWYDASGYGSSFYFRNNGFDITFLGSPGGIAQGFFTPVADMTEFHTFTSYIIAGQVSYFFDNTYLGGGHALTGASNFLLMGDGSATDVSGSGTMFVNYLTIITAVGDNPPGSIPEPAAFAALAGLGVLGLAGSRSRGRTRRAQ